MRFIQLQGFCIKLDRQTAFQEWLVANEERIKKSSPPGTEYGGVYAAVFTSEKSAGDYHWLDILDSYAALDRSAAAGQDASSDYAKITNESAPFPRPRPTRDTAGSS